MPSSASPRRTDDCATLKMMRGNIETSTPLFSSSRNRHFTAASVPPMPADQRRDRCVSESRATSCSVSWMCSPTAVVQIDRRRIDRPLVRPMLERDGEIVFPLSVARRARIVGDHRRPALRAQACARDKPKNDAANLVRRRIATAYGFAFSRAVNQKLHRVRHDRRPRRRSARRGDGAG